MPVTPLGLTEQFTEAPAAPMLERSGTASSCSSLKWTSPLIDWCPTPSPTLSPMATGKPCGFFSSIEHQIPTQPMKEVSWSDFCQTFSPGCAEAGTTDSLSYEAGQPAQPYPTRTPPAHSAQPPPPGLTPPAVVSHVSPTAHPPPSNAATYELHSKDYMPSAAPVAYAGMEAVPVDPTCTPSQLPTSHWRSNCTFPPTGHQDDLIVKITFLEPPGASRSPSVDRVRHGRRSHSCPGSRSNRSSCCASPRTFWSGSNPDFPEWTSRPPSTPSMVDRQDMDCQTPHDTCSNNPRELALDRLPHVEQFRVPDQCEVDGCQVASGRQVVDLGMLVPQNCPSPSLCATPLQHYPDSSVEFQQTPPKQTPPKRMLQLETALQVTDPQSRPPAWAPPAVPVEQLAPQLGSEELPSIGSKGHEFGTCRPCVFGSKNRCFSGEWCKFCHKCPPSEKKRRRRARKREERKAAEQIESLSLAIEAGIMSMQLSESED